jgi:hypothetical protein
MPRATAFSGAALLVAVDTVMAKGVILGPVGAVP